MKKDQRTAGTAFSKVFPKKPPLGRSFEKAAPTVLWSFSALFHSHLSKAPYIYTCMLTCTHRLKVAV